MYIINSEGTVIWSGRDARYRHEPVERIISQLETALSEATLKRSGGYKPIRKRD